MTRLFLITLSFVALAATACGPMNQKHDAGSPGAADSSDQKNVAGKPGLTKASKFVVTATVANGGKPVVNDITQYVIRFVCSDTLEAHSANAKVTVTYQMPLMPSMGIDTETAEPQTDGTFSVPVIFAMPGLWSLTVQIEDGDAKDSYEVDVQL